MKNILFLVCFGLLLKGFSQEIFQLGDSQWHYLIPEGYSATDTEGDENVLITIWKNQINDLNTLSASFVQNDNMNKLTPEVYAFFLKDTYEKALNNGELNAEVELSKLSIDERMFYSIECSILHPVYNYRYVLKYLFTSINDKEFSVQIIYDNDEDKNLLEQSLLNSKLK